MVPYHEVVYYTFQIENKFDADVESASYNMS